MANKKAMLIDVSLCVGCNACQTGCKEENGLPPNEEKHLSLTAFTALTKHNDLYVRRMCQHCDVPTCVSVCPVGALTKSAAGPVSYDGEKCIGCRYCLQACPFHVPKYEWSSSEPGKYVTRIYGEHDVGGTSMLYLSPVPFEQLGFDSRLGKIPMPMLTMSALSKVPNVLSVGGVLLAGIWWITNRRTEVQAHESSLRNEKTLPSEDEE